LEPGSLRGGRGKFPRFWKKRRCALIRRNSKKKPNRTPATAAEGTDQKRQSKELIAKTTVRRKSKGVVLKRLAYRAIKHDNWARKR